uniref:Uncharacterized protein n=1 Tax=Globisporangium ultimum (strain ATCC 200006 / CBS 805.95 / DAOM BR144) TaxID=431595 RepID=K3X485_GLOUD
MIITEKQKPTHIANLAHRQRRSKMRKEWVRKLDVHSDLYWYRDDLEGLNTAVSRFPGYAVAYAKHDGFLQSPSSSAATTAKSRVTIEATPVALSKEKIIEALNLEAVFTEFEWKESSLANPARLTVQNDDEQRSLHWREVVHLAAQGFLMKYAYFATIAASLMVPAHEQLINSV